MALTKKQATKAETIMGEAGRAQQVRRARQAVLRSKNKDKAATVETIKRVSEYKKAARFADYRPPNHGKRKQ